MWIYSSYGAMGMGGLQTLAWLMGIFGMKGMFMTVFKLGMLFPLIELGLWGYTYSTYSACSSVSDTQFDTTTSGVTQIVSCSNPSESTTTTGKFGSSGTVAKNVSEDPYITWFATNVGSATAMIWLNMFSKKPFAKAFSAPKEDDAAADADAADSTAAPADSTDSADASTDSTDPSTTDGSADPAPTTDTTDPAPTTDTTEPAGPGAGGNSNNQGFGNGADWNEPTNEPEPKDDKPAGNSGQECGFWGCL